MHAVSFACAMATWKATFRGKKQGCMYMPRFSNSTKVKIVPNLRALALFIASGRAKIAPAHHYLWH
jgi:hypothetical protein